MSNELNLYQKFALLIFGENKREVALTFDTLEKAKELEILGPQNSAAAIKYNNILALKALMLQERNNPDSASTYYNILHLCALETMKIKNSKALEMIKFSESNTFNPLDPLLFKNIWQLKALEINESLSNLKSSQIAYTLILVVVLKMKQLINC